MKLLLLLPTAKVVEFFVGEFPVKPIAFKGRYFKRVKNSNHQLSALEIADMSLQSLQVSWDAYPAIGATWKDIDKQKVVRFIDKVNSTGRFGLSGVPEDDLIKLRLINKEQITNAALLLFAKEDVPYNVHLGRLKTPEMIIDDKMLRLPLFEAVDETMKYLISQIKVAFEINGYPTQRTEIFEYPLRALKETVLNTLIHRDYLSPFDVQIKIFDNKITFFNPGGLSGSLTVDDLKKDNYQAYARNRLLAEMFYLTGDIEKYGTGFTRIRKEIATYPTMQFDFSEIPNGFLVTYSYTKQKTSTAEIETIDENVDKTEITEGDQIGGTIGGTIGGLTEAQSAVFKLIQQDNTISVRNMVIKLNINRSVVQKHIEKLKQAGVLERIGGTRGYWHCTIKLKTK
ncbi:ATP-dependent DNA helicase [Bacteroidia bacterium]|nr:ATP-dependent DNA helicase [Bacteroidia bacterium]